MNIAAIVPSLNPDAAFTQVIDGLVSAGFGRIYVVNDGSSIDFLPLFEKADAHPQVTLLTHTENKGKGRALKTAIARFLQDDTGLAGVVTVDGDGQHTLPDVLKIADAMAENPGALVLGARDFSAAHVPARSAYGNRITRTLFKAACGIPITDTQTGLRGIPAAYAKTLLGIKGERYEFETNMLLETKRHGVPVREVPISTVYIQNNEASHFRPFVDSFRIYRLILKYTASSLLSFVVDFGLFTLFTWLLRETAPEVNYLISTVAARVCSALFNFTLNKILVFGSKVNTGGALLRYGAVSVVQMLCSYGGVYLLSAVLPLPVWLGKILTDTTLFFISYFVQRKWVFRAAP